MSGFEKHRRNEAGRGVLKLDFVFGKIGTKWGLTREMGKGRLQRLQIMLDEDELAALETWRFKTQMPSRAAAVRELLRRGLASEGFEFANVHGHSESYGVIKTPDPDQQKTPDPKKRN